MKQRFSSLDVRVIAHELHQSIVPLRITNIYDLSSRIFLIKLHAPNHREQLLVDSGFRCHLTSFARTTAAAPSPFVQRLRKFLKTRRVTKVSQVGTDRIIEIELSDGLYKLYLEFYAGGNIVLTDGEAKILALLRNVDEGEAHEQLRVGLQYNLEKRQNYCGIPSLTKERVQDGLNAAIERQDSAKQDGKKKDKKKDALRKSLAVSVTEYPPMVIDHGLSVVGFDKETTPQDVLANDNVMDKLMEALSEAGKIIEEVTSQATVKGYILAKPLKKGASQQEGKGAPNDENDDQLKKNLIYDDFHPFKPQQFANDSTITFLEFDGFNKTVDEFYSSIEGQRLESKLHEREETARKKLEQAHADHEKRIGGLKHVQTLNERKAETIQANVEWVEEAKSAVNGLIGQGMDWQDIAKLIENEQRRGNQVAQIIKLPLKLHENTITLLLSEPGNEPEDEDDEGEATDSEPSDSEDEGYTNTKARNVSKAVDTRLAIDVDLGLTAWANASQYFTEKKSAMQKEERTQQASTQALKSVERKIQTDLKKGLKQEKDVLRPVRKQYWFEKFLYFISIEGYLVLGGKDAQQNELLYRKHLRKGDVYVHADLHGASSVIVKNNPKTLDAPIPPSTLAQAGNLTVCSSQAWDSKAVMGAWWVHTEQVSKTAPTGEYLTTGGFMIKGKKNYLPPAQLLLGFAVMFQISEESKPQHIKHRLVEADVPTPKALGAAEDEQAARNAEHQQNEAEAAEDEESDEDDFPDAKIDAQADESDADEDFPDATLHDQTQSDTDSGDEEHKTNSNPLQRGGAPLRRVEADGSDTEEELAKIADTLRTEEMARTSQESNPGSKSSKAHMSAHQRRLLKKGLEASTDPTQGSESEDDDAVSIAPTTSSANPNKQKPLPRGKRGKQKKLAAKYADQDEEDRELAMRILGSKTGQEAAKAEAEERKRKKEEEDAQKARRREQHLRVQAAAEEKRRKAVDGDAAGGEGAADDEDIENDEEAARLEQLGLDAFIGRPLPGDELLAAIPVCAPWQTLGNYKYKVKLQPGSTKRGKAVREILSKWGVDSKNPKAVDPNSQDGERMWPREIELIKGWKEAEVVGMIPVKGCRVMMSGGGGGSGGKGGKGKPVGKPRGKKK